MPEIERSSEDAPATDADNAALSAAPGKALSPAARRALQEAAARRAASTRRSSTSEDDGETGGPAGLEPTRFGDWERKGLAIDF